MAVGEGRVDSHPESAELRSDSGFIKVPPFLSEDGRLVGGSGPLPTTLLVEGGRGAFPSVGFAVSKRGCDHHPDTSFNALRSFLCV